MERTRRTEQVASKAGQLREIASRKDLAPAGFRKSTALIRRARFRNSPFHAELLKPGEIVQIPFEFNWAAWRLPAGAHLRVVIAPLNSPKYQKNYNTGGRIGYERPDDARVAHVRLLHDAQHASRLIVPLAAAPAKP